MGTKNAEYNAEFKSVEKVARTLALKKGIVLKDEKYHNSYTVKRLAIFPSPAQSTQSCNRCFLAYIQ
jgi:hypothetical protein